MTEELDIPMSYHRMSNDTDKAFEAFRVYRNLGPERTCRKTGEILGKSPAYMEELCRKFNWVERAGLYDDDLDRRMTRQELLDREAASIRHVRMARRIQQLAEGQIKKHNAMAKEMKGPHIDADKAAKMAKEAVLMERLVHGDPTERTANDGELDLSQLDTDDLLIFKALIVKARKKGEK